MVALLAPGALVPRIGRRGALARPQHGARESAVDELAEFEDPATSEEAVDAALDRSLTTTAFRSLPSRWQEVLWYTEIEQMKPAAVAPLLCAGITTYSPLRTWGVTEGSKVAVVGMGGLGHVAVKLAKAMGAEVTVISQTRSKEEDGRKYGATEWIATKENPDALKEHKGQFDVIINTVSAHIDVRAYMATLRPHGAMVLLGLPTEALEVNAGNLIGGRKSLTGSNIGGIRETQEMLDFCAEHGVTAEIELINADQINEAYDRVVNSDVRYRFVIDAKTFA